MSGDSHTLSPRQMKSFISKAGVLVEALPYIREFAGKTVVIKYGGAAMEDPAIRRLTAEDIVLMKYVGINPVVVHGGGPDITRMLKRLNIPSKFHNGLRITDNDTIATVEMVLAGSTNKDIVTLINKAGGDAVGLSGKDGNLLHARKVVSDDGVDLGNVGEIVGVHFKVIQVLAANGMIPVIAPIATDTEGRTWNVNADTAAGEIAAAITAEKLIFLTDQPGLLREVNDENSLIRQLRYSEVEELTKSGIIAGGMIPKIEACHKALDYGVRRTHIIDGRVPHALLVEIFTQAGLGTLVTH
jgi:acetylglutamate kinase